LDAFPQNNQAIEGVFTAPLMEPSGACQEAKKARNSGPKTDPILSLKKG